MTAYADSQPNSKRSFCPQCGSVTITECPNCAAKIKGHYHIQGVLNIAELEIPPYCDECGKPFPWNVPGASARKLVQQGNKIFIGHGRSLVWMQLKSFLTDRLHLTCDEFNEESTAGVSTVARLQEMLDAAIFAFLVMTAEDTHSDNTAHARESVVHEAGLFQGRLGFKRAIILLEQGCAEFSNIHGLTVIRFLPGDIKTAFEEIRWVLERENII